MLTALVKGAGDLATGAALSLLRAGFSVAMTELPQPLAIRRTVCFSEAVYDGSQTVEGASAVLSAPEGVGDALRRGLVAVVVDPVAAIRESLRPVLLVDAILGKRNTGTALGDAPIVVALGPGFRAGVDADAVVETARGHELGRVLFEGGARDDTGVPGEIAGASRDRVVRAPCAGVVSGLLRIGCLVEQGQAVARVGETEVRAPISGCLRGMIHDGVLAREGLKIGDIDPRGDARFCETVSDKSAAVGRAVLEAVIVLGGRGGLLRIVEH